jgi:hypothetical protein
LFREASKGYRPKKQYIKKPQAGSRPSERFTKMTTNEEYSNIGSINSQSLKPIGNNSNNYILKKKSTRSNSKENMLDLSVDQIRDRMINGNERRKERLRIGDKKHSHIYIDKNLSYSPSMANSLSKNSHTPSLLIRNNLRNIDKVSPYNYNSKSRNIYSHKYNLLNSNNSSNRVAEESYIDYSPYKKYFIKKKDQQAHWKIDRKSHNLSTNARVSSILSRNMDAKVKLPHLSNKSKLNIRLTMIEILILQTSTT